MHVFNSKKMQVMIEVKVQQIAVFVLFCLFSFTNRSKLLHAKGQTRRRLRGGSSWGWRREIVLCDSVLKKYLHVRQKFLQFCIRTRRPSNFSGTQNGRHEVLVGITLIARISFSVVIHAQVMPHFVSYDVDGFEIVPLVDGTAILRMTHPGYPS